MTTVHITTNITLEQFLEAAAQLSTAELEQLAESIGQLLADRGGAQMTTHQTERSQVSATNPLGQASNLDPSERVSEADGSESDIYRSDMSEPGMSAPENGTSLPGVTLPIVKTLIPDSLTLDGDSLGL